MRLILCFVLAICGSVWSHHIQAQERIGILLGSYGDIDDVTTELAPYIRNTLSDPDVLPLPWWLRRGIADVGWYWERREMERQYAAIGGRTGMRELSQAQAEKIAQVLQQRGYDARAYVGFTMTFPFVASALDQARMDGINKLFVIHQGAQYAKDTTQILFRHVRKYLSQHRDWDIQVSGIKSFSDDPRFVELISERINRQLSTDFAEFSADDVCIFLTMHGNVMHLAQQGDPYLAQVMRVVDALKVRFSNFDVSIGFHNHDGIPGVQWSQPSNQKALKDLAQKTCRAVLINGQISFTVDNLETLYHQIIEGPEVLQTEIRGRRSPEKIVKVDKIFNDDDDFVALMADIVVEANQGLGDILRLSPER